MAGVFLFTLKCPPPPRNVDIDADDRHLDLTFHSEARIAANTITISWTFACTKLARAAGAAFLRDDLIRPLLLMAQTFAAAPGHGGGVRDRRWGVFFSLVSGGCGGDVVVEEMRVCNVLWLLPWLWLIVGYLGGGVGIPC